MTIRPSIDIASRVSAELSAFVETLVNDPDRYAEPILHDVRLALRAGEDESVRELEYLHPADRDSMLAEVDALIDEFGIDAPAVDFIAAKASEGLSRVIESAIGDMRPPRVPSLAAVRDAMVGGLTARLIGSGALDEDDEGALLGEIDALIARYGEDALAEPLIRFE